MKPKRKQRCPPKLLSNPVRKGQPSLTLCQRYTPKIGLRLGMDPHGPPNPNPPDPPVSDFSYIRPGGGDFTYLRPDGTSIYERP